MVIAILLQVAAVVVAMAAGFLLWGVGGALLPLAAAGWVIGEQIERRKAGG